MRPLTGRSSLLSNSRQPRKRQLPSLTELNLGRKHRPDYWLLIWCAVLLAIGLVVVYSISPALAATYGVSNNYYAIKQAINVGLSLIVLLITAKVPLKWWRQSYKLILVFAGLATLLALALPVNPAYPAHRWVRFAGFSFQSVELLKFAVLLWLAGFLASRITEGQITNMKATLKPLLIALVGIGFIVAGVQSDLGSVGVMVVMMATMAFVAGLPLKRLMMIGGIVCVGLILAVIAMPYRLARVETFLHPQSNCQSATEYQACQSLIAVGSGGIFGLGLGSSVQANGYLPEAANDSIFAIYAEQFGLIGCLALLAVYVAFFSRLKRIAERVQDDYSRMLVIGVLAWLSSQALVNIGAMIGLLPLKGITLPFISYGGTSVVFTVAAVGLVYQISQYTSYSAPRISYGDNTEEQRKQLVPTIASRRASATASRNFSSNSLRRVEINSEQ